MKLIHRQNLVHINKYSHHKERNQIFEMLFSET